MDAPIRWDMLCDRINTLHMEVFQSRVDIYDFSEQKSDFARLTKKYFTDEWSSRETVDKLIDTIASNGFHLNGTITGEIGYFTCIRLSCAMDFIGMIFPPLASSSPFEDLKWSDTVCFKWLTKDLWYRRYDHYLKLWAMGGSGPFPFYGLEKADPADKE